jgi:hypothetical protein
VRPCKANVEALLSFNDLQKNQFTVRSLHNLPTNEVAYLKATREYDSSAYRQKTELCQKTLLDSARELDTHFDHLQDLAMNEVDKILMQHAVEPKAKGFANAKRTCNLVLCFGFSSE